MPTSPFDLRIKTIGGTDIGYMLWKDRSGRRTYAVQDATTISPRFLTEEQITQSQLPADIALTFPQTNWRRGIGGIRFDAKDPDVLADGTRVDVTEQGVLKLARETTASTVDSAPNEYVPSGFAVSGTQLWAFIGRDTYSWDFTNKTWDIQTEPFAAARIYRSGVNFSGNIYVPAWADDAGSSGSYVAADEPARYLYKTPTAAQWSTVTTAAQTLDGCKYMAIAGQSLWGGYWADAANSGLDVGGPTVDAVSYVRTLSTVSTLTHSHTTGSGDNRGMIACVIAEDSGGAPAVPDSVTYNSVGMTQEATINKDNVRVTLFSLINPSSGGNDCVVTLPATADTVLAVRVITLTHVSPVDMAYGGFTAAISAATSASNNATTIANNIVVDVLGINGSPSGETIGSGQTLIGAIAADTMASYEAASGTSTTMSWSWTGSVTSAQAAIVVQGGVSTSQTVIKTTGTPSDQFAAGDVIRMGSELMLVTAVTDGTSSLTVVRAYRGSVAEAHTQATDIYEITENPHHVRSAADGTAMANWSTATPVGDSGSAITGLVGVGNDLIVIKTDGIYRVEADEAVTNLRPELTAFGHNDFGKGAWAWNDLVFIPLHGGGLWELDTTNWSIKDVSFSVTMPDQAQYHGRVVAGHGEPNRLYVMVLETGNTQYNILMTENPATAGINDYNWTMVGSLSYATATDADHAALLLEAITSGAVEHHRLWAGVESTGSNLLPYFITHDTHDADDGFSSTDGEAYTVAFDAGFPNVLKRAQDIVCNTLNLTANTDTAVDTDEALDDSEDLVNTDSNPTGKIGAGDIVTIDSEDMLVVSVHGGSIRVTRGYAGTTAVTHNTNADIFSNHYIEVRYRADGGSWTYVTGSQSTSTITSANQTIAFSAGITFYKIELRFTFNRRTVEPTVPTSPELHDFALTCQLRPAAVKLLPLSFYLTNGLVLNNGMVENKAKTKRNQLRTWDTQGAEVVVTDTEGGTRNCIMLPGQMKETEVRNGYHQFPEYKCDVVLAEVG